MKPFLISIPKAIGYGFITWLVPFVIGFFLYSPDGAPLFNELFISNIFEVVGVAVGMLLLIKYFKGVTQHYAREGLYIGLIWFCINIILDLVILLPFTGMSFNDYLIEIATVYLTIPFITAGVGYITEHKKN